ncbi:MAG: hypothetical protein Q4B09_01760 [Lachnospiraceae bacterium]|nr:hypothetical protein [Lachnospiraceae bacterium]
MRRKKMTNAVSAVVLAAGLAVCSINVSAAADASEQAAAQGPDLSITSEWTGENVLSFYADGIALPLDMNSFVLLENYSSERYVYLETYQQDGTVGDMLLLETRDRDSVTEADFDPEHSSYLETLIKNDDWFPGTMQTDAAAIEVAGHRALEAGYSWSNQNGVEYQMCKIIIDTDNAVTVLLYGGSASDVTTAIDWANYIASYIYPVGAAGETNAEQTGERETNAGQTGEAADNTDQTGQAAEQNTEAVAVIDPAVYADFTSAYENGYTSVIEANGWKMTIPNDFSNIRKFNAYGVMAIRDADNAIYYINRGETEQVDAMAILREACEADGKFDGSFLTTWTNLQVNGLTAAAGAYQSEKTDCITCVVLTGSGTYVEFRFQEPRREQYAAHEIFNMALQRLVYDQGEVSEELQQLVNTISGLYQDYYTKYLQNGYLGAVSMAVDYTKLDNAWTSFYAYEPKNFAESDYKTQMGTKLESMRQEFQNVINGAAENALIQAGDQAVWGIVSGIGEMLGIG